jgi:hypothetical protein
MLKVPPNNLSAFGSTTARASVCGRERANHVRSYDFVADRTYDGKAFRMLCIIDEFSRESLAIRVATTDVIDALCELFVLRGIPAHIRSDNSPEFQESRQQVSQPDVRPSAHRRNWRHRRQY